MSTVSAILVTLRPHQWIKNAFVVAPLVFSKHLLDVDYALGTAIATAAFCALSGAVYTFNDLRDVAADRLHPIKRERPIAAGRLGENTAIAVAIILTAVAIAVCAMLSLRLAAVAASYAVVNLAYSTWLKRVAYLDVALIAAGFLLRVLAGAVVIDVPISPWLLACTGLLASLLGFGKRAHELNMAQRDDLDPGELRKALTGYSLAGLQWILVLLALATIAAYALYTQDPRTVQSFGSRHLVWTLPFSVVGIARFMQLTLLRPTLSSPTEAMLRDLVFLLNLAAWAVAVVVIVYGTGWMAG